MSCKICSLTHPTIVHIEQRKTEENKKDDVSMNTEKKLVSSLIGEAYPYWDRWQPDASYYPCSSQAVRQQQQCTHICFPGTGELRNVLHGVPQEATQCKWKEDIDQTLGHEKSVSTWSLVL